MSKARYLSEVVANPGTAGQVLTSQGADAPPVFSTPPASAGSFTAAATGSISNAATVIIKTDGTVEAVTSTGFPAGFVGSVSTLVNATSNVRPAICYDTANNKIVVFYADPNNSNYLTAVVGSISSGTISFGTPVVVASYPGNQDALDCDYDSVNQKILFVYRGASAFGRGRVGTVSGTSISFGAEANFIVFSTLQISCVYDSTSGKFLVSGYDAGNELRGKLFAATISGTSVSFGAAANMTATAQTLVMNKVTRENVSGKLICAYTIGSTHYGVVCSISGTSVTVNTAASFSASTSVGQLGLAPAGENTFVVAIYDNVGVVISRAATISGTTVTFAGSNTTIRSAAAAGNNIKCAYDSANNKVLYVADGSNTGSIRAGRVSGTTITLDSPGNFPASSSENGTCCGVTFVPGVNQFAFVYRNLDTLTTQAASYRVNTLSTNATANNFIGFSAGSYSNGQTATIKFKGSKIDGLNSLTPASKYYLQYDGTLATTADAILGSVYAGQAISSTSLIMN